jgi:mono/diheme cytochrome c family protein
MREKALVSLTGLALAVYVFVSCNSPASTASAMKRGEQIYKQTCLPCHQADGSGVQGLNPPLKNSAYVTGKDSRLIGIVLNGLSDGVEINGDAYTNPMPPFGGILNDNEIADVLTYVRNSFGNTAKEISVAQIRSERTVLPAGSTKK